LLGPAAEGQIAGGEGFGRPGEIERIRLVECDEINPK
jgi:hypothetical protein